jgi:DedD protein
VKERLTGAIILVVLIVLLVPELLSGPKGRSAPASAGSIPTSSEEPPLRSYTINLGDDSHSRPESTGTNGPAMPQPSGPEQPTVQAGGPGPDASKAQGEPPSAASATAASQVAGGSQSASSPTASSPTPEPQASGASQSSAPSQASGTSQTAGAQAAPSGEAAAPAQRPVNTPAQKPTPPASAAAPRSEAPKPARVAAALEKPAKSHPSAAATTSESGWAVQLGVFANRENAERLAIEVRVKGFKASVSPVTSGSRKLYKVRVGPTADRAAAQELQGRLKAAGRPGGTVVPYS